MTSVNNQESVSEVREAS